MMFFLSIFSAFVMGFLIGLERQVGKHPAGIRTNALVAVGAALFASHGLVTNDPATSRVAAQIVSGLGFLGAGVILRHGETVHGINTAATIWCSGAVGALAGIGHITEAFVGTLIIVGLHLCIRPLEDLIDKKSHYS